MRDDLVEHAAVGRVVREGLRQSVDQRQERSGGLRREPDDPVPAHPRLARSAGPPGTPRRTPARRRRRARWRPARPPRIEGAVTNGNSSVTWPGRRGAPSRTPGASASGAAPEAGSARRSPTAGRASRCRIATGFVSSPSSMMHCWSASPRRLPCGLRAIKSRGCRHHSPAQRRFGLPHHARRCLAWRTLCTAPTALIFDLDGTLVDTVSGRIDGWLEALEAGSGVDATRDQIAPLIGMDGKRLAREMAALAGRELVETRPRRSTEPRARRSTGGIVRPRPLPGRQRGRSRARGGRASAGSSRRRAARSR